MSGSRDKTRWMSDRPRMAAPTDVNPMNQHFFRLTMLGLLTATTAFLTACPNQRHAVDGVTPALEGHNACPKDEVATTLRDAAGEPVGRISFTSDCEFTLVTISASLPVDQGGTIHGIHVHANDDPDNGEGCIADPSQSASTHFVSADGHYDSGGGHHGDHDGDLPALFFRYDGNAWMQFATDQFRAEDLLGRAVILHASADNYGNVPVSDAANHYHPNDPAATELTQKTGNAGARVACGVIE